jgi:hypothetical protein
MFFLSVHHFLPSWSELMERIETIRKDTMGKDEDALTFILREWSTRTINNHPIPIHSHPFPAKHQQAMEHLIDDFPSYKPPFIPIHCQLWWRGHVKNIFPFHSYPMTSLRNHHQWLTSSTIDYRYSIIFPDNSYDIPTIPLFHGIIT